MDREGLPVYTVELILIEIDRLQQFRNAVPRHIAEFDVSTEKALPSITRMKAGGTWIAIGSFKEDR